MTTRHDVRLDPDLVDLKLATDALIDANGGPVKAGRAIGLPQPRMTERGSSDTDVFINIKHVAQLEDRTCGVHGHPHVTRALAARQGFALVRQPRAVPQGTDLLLLLAVQSKEAGDVAGAICAALADHVINGREAGVIRKQVRELIDVAVAMDAELAAIEEGEKA